MELLGLVIVWPLLLFALGVVFISASNVGGFGWAFVTFLAFLIFVFGLRERLGSPAAGGPASRVEELAALRRGVASFSIALFLPVFVKYMLAALSNALPAVLLGLVFGFGTLIWGIFMKGNKVLTYANTVGGALVIIYLYMQLWSLGQFAQVVATAFGLVVAVVISIVKFRDKLA